ncbi:heme ABC transporter ATP-binding protein/permease CydC [Histophilus somni]|uniref:heme ABC transporter ATP-binding protein/permease CydC n=1 Tax=Histophilus somni TaxID=731 RepID=UPI00094B0CDF|nr:cysteine/glutathione ABC transporter ATP-binding protein/permease CydC [Histophilus somni]
MRALLPFLRLFYHAKFTLILGGILMIAGLASSIGLLTLSGWFLAATALAGIGTLFNFFYPSASVRGLAIGRTVTRYFEKIVTHDATFRVLAKLRVQVFSKLIPLSPAVLNRYRNSDLLNRLVADVDTLDTLYLRLIAPFISAMIVIAFITLGLSLFNVSIGVFIGISLLLLLLIIPIVFYRLGRKFGAKLTQSRSVYRTYFIEFIQSQAELLLFNAAFSSKEKLKAIELEWQSYQQQETNLVGLSTALVVFINGLLVVITLWFAAKAQFSIADYHNAFIALFAFAALASFELLMPISAAFLHIGQVISSAERINELLAQRPLVQFNGTRILQNNEYPLIQLKNVSFSYPDRNDQALQQINFTVEAGKKVAVLGKTGSGKSSLLQLLVRNYDCNQGEILLSNAPIQVYTEETLRQNICLLTQRVHIFSDTLRNNLQIAGSQQISDEKMCHILQKVGLEKLVQQDQGLDLWLGDGGRPLSGGEQRRLGLARVLLNNAPIILFDEPTEGLDRDTERHVLTLLFEHCQNKTFIMVTHRLTALEQFDLLCIMDNSHLVEQGHYHQLIQQEKGFFKQLIERI